MVNECCFSCYVLCAHNPVYHQTIKINIDVGGLHGNQFAKKIKSCQISQE